LLVVLAVAAFVLAGAYVHTAYQDRALPGAGAAGVHVAGLTEAETEDVLDVAAHPLLAAPAVFFYGSREWHPTAAQMGLSVDTAHMAHEALAAGRTWPAAARWFQEALAPAVQPQVPLRATLDQRQAAAFLGAVALEVDRAPANAALSINNGQVVAGQSAAGQQVDVAATLERIRLPRALDDVQRVEVAVAAASPAVSDAAAGEAKALAARVLAAPLTLHLGERTWALSPSQLGAMLDVKRVDAPGGSRFEVALNDTKVAAYVKTVAAEIDRPAVDAQLRWGGSGVAVVRESRDGLKLDQAAATRAIIAQAALDNRDVALNTSVAKPAVASDNVSQLGIKEPIATGSSKFAGSTPERMNNIRVAASRLDGTVIPAGATLSFLTALGPITKANGYQEGLTIVGDATVPGIGGGVCQVSTTIFRAAFYAGLPMVERHQHSYRVGYYEQDGSPVGFDAAVYDPGVDLRFKNDTGAAILLQSAVDTAAATLTFRLYGTGTGRDVKLAASKANEVPAGPRLPDVPDPTLPKGARKQVEWKTDGVDATIRRTVTQGGQSLLADAFFSRYVPWQEKWLVGTGPAA
jgi:vancomycin resistance protein YoaR